MAPGISHVGMIYNSDNPVGALYLQWFETVAPGLAVQAINLPVRGVAELEHVIERLAEQPGGAFIVPPDVTITALATEITALAARYGVPAVYSSTLYARRGGLASYGTDFGELWRGLASYVNRVLRGEKPADLPVQQPKSYQLVINLKTAKALGLEIPPNCSHWLMR